MRGSKTHNCYSVQSCVSDSSSQAQGLNCGGLASTKMLFQTAAQCCTQMVPWVATATCVAESMRKFPRLFSGFEGL